jgi:hypothetical protein
VDVGGSGCVAALLHSEVPGAVGYVIVTSTGARVPCSSLGITCVATFPNGAPGSGNTLHAVDANGVLGFASEPFTIRESPS